MTANAGLIETLEEEIKDLENKLETYQPEIDRLYKLIEISKQELKFLKETLDKYNALHQSEPKKYRINAKDFILNYAEQRTNIVNLNDVASVLLTSYNYPNLAKAKLAARKVLINSGYKIGDPGVYVR